jgi:anti-sigma B factor antagonist
MPATEYSVQMAGGVPVITAPAEIDVTTVGELRAIFLEWQSRGHTTLVVDVTGTQFCDSAGLRELVRAHKRAVADGGGLQLVMAGDGAFVRVFTVTGLDGIIPRFATLKQALAQVTDSRRCEHCGAVFAPAREHARFCGGDCRAAWNREHLGDPAVEASALTWSITAMTETIGRLPVVQAADLPEAFAAIGEAVWWITMVDATLVRHHRSVYDAAMAAHTPAEWLLIEQTLAGLRFVRNWISRGAELGEAIETGAAGRRITYWRWKPVPEPAPAWLSPRAHAWELARYRAYQERLADHTIGKTLGLAATFLTLTATDAASMTDVSQDAPEAARHRKLADLARLAMHRLPRSSGGPQDGGGGCSGRDAAGR